MTAKTKKNLETLRGRVDRIDRGIVRLLNDRMRMARRIGRLKARNGRKIFDAARERKLLRRLLSGNRGPMESSELSAIYRLILKTSRRHQRRVRG